MPAASCDSVLSAHASIFLRKTARAARSSRRSLELMRDLQVSPPRFKITKLCFGILDGVNTFARAKVLRSVTPRDLVAHDIPSARYVGTRYVVFADAICFALRNVKVKIRLADFFDFIIFRLGFIWVRTSPLGCCMPTQPSRKREGVTGCEP